MKKLFLLALVAVFAISLAGCGSSKEDGENVFYTNRGPVEFFESTFVNPGLQFTNKVLFDRLIISDASLTPEKGQLAESYSLSADGLTLTFNLREDVKWHDGIDFTGEDVKFTLEYAIKVPGLNPLVATTINKIEGAEEYVAGTASEISGITVSGNTLTIVFETIDADALVTFAQFPPLPKHKLENTDPLVAQQAEFWQWPVGTGPFEVEEVNLGTFSILSRFADYWDTTGTGNIDKIHVTASLDADPNLVVNAESGQLDYAFSKSTADVSGIEALNHMSVNPVNIRYTRLFYFNKFPQPGETSTPMANLKVRQAVAYAVDVATLNATLLEGRTISADSLTENGPWKPTGLEKYELNKTMAQSLLAEANWDSNYVVDIAYYYTDQLTVDLMTAIQAQLAEVGITAEFRLLTGDVGAQAWTPPVDGEASVTWDILYGAIGASVLNEFYGRFHSTSTNNSHTPADTELDALIEATQNTNDVDDLMAAYHDLADYMNEELPCLPLYYTQLYVFQSNNVDRKGNDFGNDQWVYDWRIIDWDVEATVDAE